jgi:hypothetical protein
MQIHSGDDIKRKHSAAIDPLRGRCRFLRQNDGDAGRQGTGLVGYLA